MAHLHPPPRPVPQPPLSNSTAPYTYSNSTAATNNTICGARPAYTLNSIIQAESLGYSDTFTTIMTCGVAAKISLMGAVSSTHGNSMGQRTSVSSCTCPGSQCTITTPPSTHITGGPSWLMLFVLYSNGVPSTAQWGGSVVILQG